MGSKRDDFKLGVVRTLREQVAFRCSNPDCRISTAGPGEASDGVNRVGQAAHITAASPGGPRYDPTLSPAERSSASNGIWLCNICAKKIDNSATEYPVEMLREWKKKALRSAKEELGQKLPEKADAINLATAMLTGQGTSPVKADSIGNIHTAYKNALSNQNPGYSFDTEYQDGKTLVSVTPPPEKPILVNFDTVGDESSESFKAFLETGQPAELDITNFRHSAVSILPNIEQPHSGKLQITSNNQREALVKIRYKNKESKNCFLDDIKGNISSGTKAAYFKGSAYGDVLTIELIASPGKGYNNSIKINLNYGKWDSKKLPKLPYIRKLSRIFKDFIESDQITFLLEVEGESAYEAKINDTENFKSSDIEILFEINKLAEFCRATDQELTFNTSELRTNDLKVIDNLFDDLSFRKVGDKDSLSSAPTFTAELNEDANHADFFDKKRIVRIEQSVKEPTTIMGQEIEIPILVQEFRNVVPSVDARPDEDGRQKVVLNMEDDFEHWRGFKLNNPQPNS